MLFLHAHKRGDNSHYFIPLHKVDYMMENDDEDLIYSSGEYYIPARNGAWWHSIIDVKSTKEMIEETCREVTEETRREMIKETCRRVTKEEIEKLKEYMNGKGKLDDLEG